MTSSPEILKHTPETEPKKVIELSREALAKRLGIDESDLPDRKFFKIVDKQLDKLANLDYEKKIKATKEELARIDTAEAADKAKELAEKGKDMLT